MNPMQRPMGGAPMQGGMPQGAGRMPPQGMPPGGGAGLPQNRDSLLNPMDMVKKTQMGQVRPDMSIREFFSSQGLDVDQNTVADLGQFLSGQVKNRTMAGKLGAPGATGGMSPATPAPKPGLQGLMGKLGA